jgi:16S rRNA (guanine527-N7)-methyltransferase
LNTSLTGRSAELAAGCNEMLGERPAAEVRERLLVYLDLLAHWNQAYNLSAVRDPDQMVCRHLLDSLSVLPWLESGPLLDAGTGAGLPGVPLAIMRPGLEVTLLDSAGKKIRFLRHVKRELGLGNIHPLQQHLESARPDTEVTCIISRAFSDLSKYAAAARHLLKPDSKLLAMKGRCPNEEIARLPGWIRVDRVEKLSVPGLHEQRHLVMMSLTA